jgi:hypothetical protein
MKAIPTHPLAKHQRMIDALCSDILDRNGFNRLDTLRYLNSRDGERANNASPSNHGNAA